jgi:hypothetical protein
VKVICGGKAAASDTTHLSGWIVGFFAILRLGAVGQTGLKKV